MSWLNLVSLLGCVTLMLLAWAIGGFRRPIPWRTVTGSSLLMLTVGLFVFWLAPFRIVLVAVNDAVLAALQAGNAGAEFLFGPLARGPGEATAAGEPSVGFVLAAQVLPAVIFFASLMALLYHLGVMQPIIRLLGRLFHRALALSGAEALGGASNIFVGVESATTVRPYLERMTRSELLTLMTCGMSTVASTTLAIYVLFLGSVFPRIAGHLISASLLSIPAAALMSKLILPETEQPETRGAVPPTADVRRHESAMASLAGGAWDGLKLAAGIATLLIAVLGLVALLDLLMAKLSAGNLDLGTLLGWIFTPVAWLLGIAPNDIGPAGRLLGERLILTEVVAYRDLADMAAGGALSRRTLMILSYALCGFAHVASMAIFVGGFSALAPTRREDLARLAWRALAAATLATLLTGALAGTLYHGQASLLGL